MAGRFLSLVKVVSRQPKIFLNTAAFRPATIAACSVRSFGNYVPPPTQTKPEPFLDVKEATDRIINVIKNFEKVNAAKVTATAKFKEDLELDSLDAVEVVMAIEEEFNIEIPDSEADKILSVHDAVAYITAHPMAK